MQHNYYQSFDPNSVRNNQYDHKVITANPSGYTNPHNINRSHSIDKFNQMAYNQSIAASLLANFDAPLHSTSSNNRIAQKREY